MLLATGTTTLTVKEIQRHETSDAQWDIGRIDSRILETGPHIVRVIPTKFPNQIGWTGIGKGKTLGLGDTAKDMIEIAYEGASTRTIFLTPLPPEKYDFIANLSSGSNEALRQELKKQFGVTGRHETIETNVLFLQIVNPKAQGLKPARTQDASSSRFYRGELTIANQPIASVANFAEGQFGIPVIDRTGLTGSYDVNFNWNYQKDPGHKNLQQALYDQLGLVLVPGTAPVEMLVVEKAN